MSDHEKMSDEEDTKDKNLSNPDVVTKYKLAAEITNDTLKVVIESVLKCGRVVDICSAGDEYILSRTAKVFAKGKVEKGIAFPVSLSINHLAGHFSPLAEEETCVKPGDMVKIDLGVHIDGFAALVAHTVVVPDPAAPGPISGKKANVIAACYTAAEAVLRLIQPGVKNNRVSEYITKVADEFRCQPLQGVLSHELRQFVIDANNTIIGKIDPDQGLKVDEFEFETNQVFGIDIVMSTGDGKGRELNEQTTVFKREVDVNYNLKMQASRRFLAEVNRRFPTYPFTLRSIEDKSARLGLTECLKHDLLQPYPVLFEKEGEFVAQLKFTVLLMPSGIMKITGLDGVDLSQIQSEYSVQDEDLKALLAQPIKSKKRRRKKNKKKKNTANEGGEAAMDVE
eukprot:809398_1